MAKAESNSSVASREEWLWLMRAPGLGAGGIRALLERFGSLAGALGASPSQWRAAGLSQETADWMAGTPREPEEADRQWLAGENNSLLTLEDADYPALLRRIPDPPAVLYVVGNPDALWLPQIAIVGSRNATPGGLENAADFSATFVRAGFGVVSGLAEGVDGAAHVAALKAGGVTVAVLGTGADRVYPARHRALAHEIPEAGALVSEYPPGTPPNPKHFPRRNRIISGLSLGVLVVEAGMRSGSLITARLAGEQSREVFALPGSIHNPMAKGCHRLIRQGAKLVETAEEVLEELSAIAGELADALRERMGEIPGDTSDSGTSQTAVGGGDGRLADPEYRALVEAMGHDPVAVDQLVQRTGLTVDSVSSMLLILELEGHINALPGGVYVANMRESGPSDGGRKKSP